MAPPLPTPRDLPAIPPDIDPALREALNRMREEIQRMMGYVGVDRLDMALTWRQLQAMGLAALDGVATGRGGRAPGTIVVPASAIDAEPDLTPPPTPTSFGATAGFSFVVATWGAPTYTQGHGHAQTNIYGVQRPIPDPGAPPVFGDASRVTSVFGSSTITSFSSEMKTRWHLWAKWESIDGIESLTPAGGTNGVTVDTGEDVRHLIDALSSAAFDPASPYSRAAFRADQFIVAPVVDFYQEATPTGTANGDLWFKPSTGVTKTWDGAAWQAFNTPLPFIVQTVPTTINGVSIPAGVYMDSAFIYDLTASIARLGTAWIDNAMVANLSAAKLTVGDGTVGGDLKSTTYTAGSGSTPGTGWKAQPNGNFFLNNAVVYGTIYASAGELGSLTVGNALTMNTTGHIKGGQTAYNTGTGFFLGYSGAAYKFSIGDGTNGLTWDGTALNIVGSGTFTGTLKVGTSPAVSGSTMTGTGAVFNADGTYAIGNSTRNLSFNGTTLTINGSVISSSNLQTGAVTETALGLGSFTISIGSGDLTVAVDSGDQTYGTRTATPSGGTTPYAYAWAIVSQYSDTTPEVAAVARISSGIATATVEVSGNGTNTTIRAYLECTVTDANGRVAKARFLAQAAHGVV